MRRNLCLVVLAAFALTALGCSCKRWQQQVDDLKADLIDSRAARDTLSAELARREQDVGQLATDLENAQAQARDLALVREQLEQERAEREKRIGKLKELIAFREGFGLDPRPEGDFLVVENSILFESGKIELTAEAKTALDSTILAYLQEFPDQIVRIDGHTDGQPITVSPWIDNDHLSLMRAHAVKRHLVSKGIDTKRMYVAGFGPNRPKVAPPADDPTKAIAENRRVEFLLVSPAGRSIQDIIGEIGGEPKP